MISDIRKEIETIVLGLGDLVKEVVFVGGALPVFYVNQELFEEPRPTEDIDCIVEIATRAELYNLEENLRSKGFENVSTMIARWRYKGIIVDIMPTSEEVFGFSNRWYKAAIKENRQEVLPGGNSCSILTLPYFLVTKLEALGDRGGDLRMSKDLEDILYVINGSSSVLEEVSSSSSDVRQYISEGLAKLRKGPNFDELMESNLSRSNLLRKSIVIERFDKLIG